MLVHVRRLESRDAKGVVVIGRQRWRRSVEDARAHDIRALARARAFKQGCGSGAIAWAS
jgi:hypothetical protein